MQKKKNPFINAKNAKSGSAIMTSGKTNAINGGIQNAGSLQNPYSGINPVNSPASGLNILNMPQGVKKPENTSK